MICVGLRALLDRFNLGQFVDDETQKRITGSSVDLMVTASLLSINFALLTEFWQPILLVASLVTLVTAVLCFTAGLDNEVVRVGGVKYTIKDGALSAWLQRQQGWALH